MTKSNQEVLLKLTDLTQENLENEQFGVSKLAQKTGMSRSNLHRKVHALLNIPASQFIQQKRLKKSMELLCQNSFAVSEVSYKVGFGSVT